MKKFKNKSFIILTFLLALTSCKGQKELQVRNVKELSRVNGRFYYLDDIAGYTGIIKQFDEKSPEKLVGRAEVKNGLLNGMIEGFDLNGNLLYQQSYKDGKLDGKTIGYNTEGQPTYERNFSMGNSEGLYRIYYKNGQIKYEENYKKNKIDGESLSYLEDGTLEQKRIYEDGILKEEYNYGEEEGKISYIFSVDRNQSNVLKKVE